jgi:hypothetical protein
MQVESRRWSAGTITFGEQHFNRAPTPQLYRQQPHMAPPEEYSLFSRLLRSAAAPRVPPAASFYDDACPQRPRGILPSLS